MIIVNQRIHDGYIIYWTTEALNSNTMGFYFDANGQPQHITRESVYASHIRQWEKEKCQST